MDKQTQFDLRPNQIAIVGAPRNDRLLSADFAQVQPSGLAPGEAHLALAP